MDNNYGLELCCDFISHYGKGHNSNPPGRGSGRYPWGSGAKNGKTPIHENGEKKHKLTKGNTLSTVGDVSNKHGNGSNVFNSGATREINVDHESARLAALESGDRKEILKYFNESSYLELQQALNKADLKDRLNKSLSSTYQQQSMPTDEAQKMAYIKQELGSGDLKRIMAVATDQSVSSKDLNDAINKAIQIQTINQQINPSITSRVDNVLSKSVNTYNKVAPIYNLAAIINNQVNPKMKMPVVPVKQNKQQPQAQTLIRNGDKNGKIADAMKSKLSIFKEDETMKTAVKDYSKKYWSWYKRQNINDNAQADWEELYKALGPTDAIRIYHSIKQDTPEAREYFKKYEEWSTKQDALNKEWETVVQPAFNATGKNTLARVINNIRYDTLLPSN